MKDIRIDDNGDMRCWSCGARGFTEKRTFRSKAIGATAGVATLGVAAAATPLLTKKKMRCQACGKYNQVGKAKAWEGSTADSKPAQPTPKPVSAAPAPRPILAKPVAQSYSAQAIDPVIATGYRATVTFDGTTVSLDKKFGAPRHRDFPITEVSEVELMAVGKEGKDGVGIVFTRSGVKPPKPKLIDVHVHDDGIAFEPEQRAEAEALMAIIEEQRITDDDDAEVVDLDREEIHLRDGRRLTNELAEKMADSAEGSSVHPKQGGDA